MTYSYYDSLPGLPAWINPQDTLVARSASGLALELIQLILPGEFGTSRYFTIFKYDDDLTISSYEPVAQLQFYGEFYDTYFSLYGKNFCLCCSQLGYFIRFMHDGFGWIGFRKALLSHNLVIRLAAATEDGLAEFHSTHYTPEDKAIIARYLRID